MVYIKIWLISWYRQHTGFTRCLPPFEKKTLCVIQGPNENINEKNQFTTSLIYAIECKRCKTLYPGETQNRIGGRVSLKTQDPFVVILVVFCVWEF